MLLSMGALLRQAREESYAVGSFSVDDVQTTVGVLEAAVGKRSTVIIAIPVLGEDSHSVVMPPEALFSAAVQLAAAVDVPAAVLLDHGYSLE